MVKRFRHGDRREAVGRETKKRTTRSGQDDALERGAAASLEALENRVVLAIDRQQAYPALAHRGGHHFARYNQNFLIGECDVLAGGDRRERGSESERADQRRNHDCGVRMSRHGDRALPSMMDFRAVGRTEPPAELTRQFGRGDRDQFRPMALDLADQQIEIAPGRHRCHPKAVAEAIHHVERGDADRARGAENRYRLHVRLLCFNARRVRRSACAGAPAPSAESSAHKGGSAGRSDWGSRFR